MIFIYVKLTVFTRVFEGGKVHLTLRSIDSISRDSKNAITLKLDIFGSHFGHFVRKLAKWVEKFFILIPYSIDSNSRDSKNDIILK